MKSFFAVLMMLAVMALTNSNTTLAQDGLTTERPKIGLVLSGGGAMGVAHVGVIRVLEELKVPIDFIAGTSMGAIVGGLYASGLSADELEDAVRSIDWNDIFIDKPIRSNRDFRRKLDDEGFLISYKLGFKDGKIQFPRGIINAQKLDLTLRKLTKHAVAIHDFDKLPTPFRAVAADIETGKSVIIGSGDLAIALRASMAVSGFFPPVERNGRLLVDGGITNNLPMDVVRKMGADILIVVHFPENLMKREKLNSAVPILTQSLAILINQNSNLQLKSLREGDILIEPRLGDIDATSFTHAVDAIPMGEKAARAASSRLKRLARYHPSDGFHTPRRKPTPPQSVTLDFVKVENKSRLSDDLIWSRLRLRPGDKIDLKVLEQDLANIYGLDYFETVTYRIAKEGDKNGIIVTATEKSQGLDSFRFGLNLENDFNGDSAYNVSVRYQREGLNELGGELDLQAIIGEKLGFVAAFIQPLDPATRYFVTSRISYLERDVPIFDDGSQTSEFRVSEITASLTLARQLGNWGALSLGLQHGYGWIDRNIGVSPPADENFSIGNFFTRFNVDTLDNLNFPNDGTKAKLEFRQFTEALGNDDDYSQLSAKLLYAQTWGQNTILASADAGITLGGDAPTQDLFTIGGLFNLSGFQSDELSGQNFLLGGLVAYRNIGARPGSFGVPVYIGASLEAGNVWGDRSDIRLDDLLIAGSIFFGLDTPLGPVYIAYGHAEGGNDSAYLFLGQTF